MLDFRRLLHRDERCQQKKMDIEELKSIAIALRNAKSQPSSPRLATMIAAIELCLLQQKKLLGASPEFAGKEEIIRYTTLAQALGEKISADVQQMLAAEPARNVASVAAA